MKSNSLMKKVLVLVFLLVILVAVFIMQGDNFGEGYFSWLKMKLIGMGPELNLAEEDSGLDLTNINIENTNASVRPEIKEDPKPIIEVIPETSGPSVSEVLLEIEQEINQIAKEIERINGEILKLQNK